MKRKTKLAFATAALTGAGALAGVAVATPAHASGQYCSDTQFNVCVTVDGYSNYIDWVKATATSTMSIGFDTHVQLTNPNGVTLCNSATSVANGPGLVQSCTSNLNAWTVTGNYCATEWEYIPGTGAGIGGSGWYTSIGKSCLYVFTQ